MYKNRSGELYVKAYIDKHLKKIHRFNYSIQIIKKESIHKIFSNEDLFESDYLFFNGELEEIPEIKYIKIDQPLFLDLANVEIMEILI